MSGPGTGTPDSGFQDRLNRMQERRAPIEAARPQVDVLPDWKENVRYPATLVSMALLGMLTVFIARFVRFHLLGGTLAGDAPDVAMVIDAGLAAVAGFVILTAVGLSMREANRLERSSMFSLNGLGDNPMRASLVVGIAIMIGTMHNLVYSMPSAFSVLFSEEWTEDIMSYSEPGSIYFRGNYFVVLPQAEETATDEAEPEQEQEEKKVLPKVRRL